MKAFMLGAVVLSVLGGCARPEGASGGAAERPPVKFEHVQFSFSPVGGLIFFDQETGKVWAYQGLDKPPVLVSTLETLGKPMIPGPDASPAPKMAKAEPVTPEAPVAPPTAVAKPAEANATAVVERFNRLPRELWPSVNETGAVREARNDWLEKTPKPASDTVTGTISDVSSRTLEGGKRPDGTTEFRKVLQIDVDGGNVRVWGKDVPLKVIAVFDSVPAEEGLKRKKGERVRITGRVENLDVWTGLGTPEPSAVFLRLRDAHFEK